jgi:hypothetical protein
MNKDIDILHEMKGDSYPQAKEFIQPRISPYWLNKFSFVDLPPRETKF